MYNRELGSAAAPTAGLHFTKELMQKIKEMGVEEVFVTLNVGLGTFRPVSEERIEDHEMHSEFYTVPLKQPLLEPGQERGPAHHCRRHDECPHLGIGGSKRHHGARRQLDQDFYLSGL